MTRFLGTIGINRGFVETAPGIQTPNIEQKIVQGEIRTLGARWSNAGMDNTIRARHVLSMVTPESSMVDFTEVVYVIWQTRKWAVTQIEYKRPRVELTLGGLYND